MSYLTHSPQGTLDLGERLGRVLGPGDTVLLEGDLGAGKSVLARGIARGLGVEGPLPSPTFQLLHVYQGGRCPLYHMDLYRLTDADDYEAAGLHELVGTDGVALIEWPQRAEGALPVRLLRIVLARGEGEDQRLISLFPQGGFVLDGGLL